MYMSIQEMKYILKTVYRVDPYLIEEYGQEECEQLLDECKRGTSEFINSVDED